MITFLKSTIFVAVWLWNNNIKAFYSSHLYLLFFHPVSPCSSVPHLWVCALQTVELSDCEKTQALALRVLLSLSKFNQHRIHEMDCYHGYSMIHQVLIKSKCTVGYHMLKVSHSMNSLLFPAPTTSADRCKKTYAWNVVPWIRTSPPHLCLSEPLMVTPLLLDPLAVSVIELCDGWALKWILSHLMKHRASAQSHSSSDCPFHFRLPRSIF